MFEWVVARLAERSTWLGIVGFLTAAGVALDPGQTEALVVAGVAVAGLIYAITADKTPPPAPPA